MNNTIPFHPAAHAPQITVDVNILSMLKQAASCLTEMTSENIYLAAIGPDMELTIINQEPACGLFLQSRYGDPEPLCHSQGQTHSPYQRYGPGHSEQSGYLPRLSLY